MPSKTKETTKNEEINKVKKATKKTASSKNTTTQKKAFTKKSSTASKKASAKSSSTPKKSTSKKSSTATKKVAKNAVSTSKKSIVKKSATKKSSAKKKTSAKKSFDKPQIIEYYDLPFRYNQTIVKVLAQTPKTLFIYWDISDEDRDNFIKTYGKSFFNTTKPVLIVKNITMNYTFEVDINDFANSWYLHVNDADSKYEIELGRRPLVFNEKIRNNYIYVSSSNKIDSPNDHILFDKDQKMVYFRNVKTNAINGKNIASLSFIRNMGKIYNIYDLYKKIYKEENLDEFVNPSSSSFR